MFPFLFFCLNFVSLGASMFAISSPGLVSGRAFFQYLPNNTARIIPERRYTKNTFGRSPKCPGVVYGYGVLVIPDWVYPTKIL